MPHFFEQNQNQHLMMWIMWLVPMGTTTCFRCYHRHGRRYINMQREDKNDNEYYQ